MQLPKQTRLSVLLWIVCGALSLDFGLLMTMGGFTAEAGYFWQRQLATGVPLMIPLIGMARRYFRK